MGQAKNRSKRWVELAGVAKDARVQCRLERKKWERKGFFFAPEWEYIIYKVGAGYSLKGE
jgi:hypothetical protein